MVDLFEEVEESLRADQLKAAGRRVLPWVIGLVVGVLVIGGGFVGWRYWTDHKVARASEAFDAVLRSGGQGDPEADYKAFADISAKAPAGYKTLALILQGAIRHGQGRDKDAVALWDQAAKAAPRGDEGQVLADMARLKSALALLDDAKYDDIEKRLSPLTDEGRPFRAMARELLAVAKLNAGKTQEARADFVVLTADPGAPQGVAERARAAVGAIDSGSAAGVAAAVKAAKAMPAPSQMQLPPGLLEQLQAQGIQMQGAPAQ